MSTFLSDYFLRLEKGIFLAGKYRSVKYRIKLKIKRFLENLFALVLFAL